MASVGDGDTFEWGSDGDSVLSAAGGIKWSQAGTNLSNSIQIDTDLVKAGTRSLCTTKWSGYYPAFYCGLPPASFSYQLDCFGARESTCGWNVIHGNGTKAIRVGWNNNGTPFYYDGSGATRLLSGYTMSSESFRNLRIRNIDFDAGFYDLYIDYNRLARLPMMPSTSASGRVYFQAVAGNGVRYWIDNFSISGQVYQKIPCFDHFQWGDDGTYVTSSLGGIRWAKSGGDDTVVEIDSGQYYEGDRSARFYNGSSGTHYPTAVMDFIASSYAYIIHDRVMHEMSAGAMICHGNGKWYIYCGVTSNGRLFHYGRSGHANLTGAAYSSNDSWHLIELKNLDFDSGCFDFWYDGVLISSQITMQETGTRAHQLALQSYGTDTNAWHADFQIIPATYPTGYLYSWPLKFPLEFDPPPPTGESNGIYVRADWNRDGVYTSAHEDISAQVKGFNVEYGRNEWLESAIVGQAQITMVDTSGTYIPYNTSSPIVATYGGIYPGTPIEVKVIRNSTYTLFTGYLDDVLPNPRKDVREAVLKCVDGLEFLKMATIDTGIQENVYSGGASGMVHMALDQAGWDASKRIISSNQTDSYSLIYCDSRQTLNFLQDLEASEFAFCYCDTLGNFRWEDRHHRLTDPRCTSSQWICSEDKYQSIEADNALKSIYNKVIIKAQPRTATTGLSSIWTLTENASSNNSISITAGDTKTFWASFQAEDDQQANIAKDVQTPTSASGDYSGNSAQDGSGDDMTASLSVSTTIFAASAMVRVKNTHATDSVYLTKLRLRGNIYKNDPPLTVTRENTSSQALYSMNVPRTWEKELAYYQGYDTLDGMALNILEGKEEPQKGFNISLLNKDSDVYDQILERRVSDRVTLQNSDYMISGDFYLEKIRWEMERGQGGKIMRADWRLLDETSIGGVFWVLDTSQLGDGYLYPTRLSY